MSQVSGSNKIKYMQLQIGKASTPHMHADTPIIRPQSSVLFLSYHASFFFHLRINSIDWEAERTTRQLPRDNTANSSVMESTAKDKVLGTTELIERILLHVDMYSLLVSVQRVCRRWTEVIKTSPSLQRGLFLQPDPRPLRQGEVRIKNPLLAWFFRDWFPYCWGAHEYGYKLSEIAIDYDHIASSRIATDSALNAALRHPSATWRKMLPCQPPFRGFVRCSFSEGLVRWETQLSLITKSTIYNIDSVRGYLAGFVRPDRYFSNQYITVPTDIEPITMDTLYHIVILGYGSSKDWLFVWSDGGGDRIVNIPPIVRASHGAWMTDEFRYYLGHILYRDGIIMFDSKPRPDDLGERWRFNPNLVFREDITQLW
jgi:hypothetical protein